MDLRRRLFTYSIGALGVIAFAAAGQSQLLRNPVRGTRQPLPAATGVVAAACAQPLSLPVQPAGGVLVWRTCDASLSAMFDYGANDATGLAFNRTGSNGATNDIRNAGDLPVLPGAVAQAYFEVVGVSGKASITYAAPRADRSQIVSPNIRLGANYEIVAYERMPYGPNAGFRLIYQSAVYEASSPRVLFVKSPLAGLTVPQAAHVYFALLAMPFEAAVTAPASARAVSASALAPFTVCRGQVGTRFDPNTGSFVSDGAAHRPGLPCFATFAEYAVVPARIGAYSLAFASSTDNALGSVPASLCGSFRAPCGTPLLYISIKPSVNLSFSGAKPYFGLGVLSAGAIALGNQYAASVYDVGSKRTLESLAFVHPSAAEPHLLGFQFPLAALPATGAVLIVYRQPPLPSLAISKSDNSGTSGWAIAQTGAAYALALNNTGNRVTSGTIGVDDTLPAGLTLSAMPSGKGWTCAGKIAGTGLSCSSTAAIAPGANAATITVPVSIGPSTATGIKAITNTAKAYGGGDPAHATVASAATGSDATSVKSPTLAIAKTDNGGTAGWTIGQTGAAYSLAVSNVGGLATTGTITVTDTLPSGLTLDGNLSNENPWTCTAASSTTLSCTATYSMPPGGTVAPITVPVSIGPSTALGTKAISNTAKVYGGGDPVHPAAASAATGTDATTITTTTLALSSTDNGGTGGWAVGQAGAAYTLTVSNRGNQATTGTITVSDTFPAGLALSAAPAGAGWLCTGNIGSAALSCSSTAIVAPGTSGAPITVPVNIGACNVPVSSNLTNTALAYGGGDPLHSSLASAVSGSDSTNISNVTKIVCITGGTTWTVPADWNNSVNTIEAIGGGSDGGSVDYPYDGGGGGAYSAISNAVLTSGATVTLAIGAHGSDTYFCNSTSGCTSLSDTSVIVGAQGGGGSAAAGVGTIKYSGGPGGPGDVTTFPPGYGGGGGAAGRHGAGAPGGGAGDGAPPLAEGCFGGGGGSGGGDGGWPGCLANGTVGGNGGNNYLGFGGGTALQSAWDGGGGAAGAAGGNGTEFDALHGSGGGGGSAGGAGGTYGGGGGANSAGASGIIVITYSSATAAHRRR
jgi:uncharacterized repeat protein (TIGR01451 family)